MSGGELGPRITDEEIRPDLSDEYPTLEDAVRWELQLLWSRLDRDVHSALSGRWSIACDWTAGSIIRLSRFVGPTPWEQIGVTLLLNGIYEAVYRKGGIEYPPIDWDQVRAVDERNRAGL